MDAINQDPKTLSIPKLDGCIEWLVARGRESDAAAFRREKLNRAYVDALNARIVDDPYLGNTTQVIVKGDE